MSIDSWALSFSKKALFSAIRIFDVRNTRWWPNNCVHDLSTTPDGQRLYCCTRSARNRPYHQQSQNGRIMAFERIQEIRRRHGTFGPALTHPSVSVFGAVVASQPASTVDMTLLACTAVAAAAAASAAAAAATAALSCACQ